MSSFRTTSLVPSKISSLASDLSNNTFFSKTKFQCKSQWNPAHIFISNTRYQIIITLIGWHLTHTVNVKVNLKKFFEGIIITMNRGLQPKERSNKIAWEPDSGLMRKKHIGCLMYIGFSYKFLFFPLNLVVEIERKGPAI